MVVEHRTTIKLVFAHDERRLENLERAMRDGGEPIGTIGFIKESKPAEPSTLSLWRNTLVRNGFRLVDPRAVRKLQSRMSSEGVLVDELEDHNGYVDLPMRGS